MTYDNLVTINVAFCLFIFWACVCRLKMTSASIKIKVRSRYILIGAGALFGAFGNWVFPFYGGAYAGLVILVVALAVAFWLDKADWEHGPPESAHTQPGELHEDKPKR